MIKKVTINPKHKIPIVQKPLKGKLGYLDIEKYEIVINADQPEAGKQLILLHELIHLIAEHLKDEKLINRQPDEKFVTYLAGHLFPILVESGLWNTISKRSLRKFLAGNTEKKDIL
jgi:Zn-dependent peptidase ImmA (M78 family)